MKRYSLFTKNINKLYSNESVKNIFFERDKDGNIKFNHKKENFSIVYPKIERFETCDNKLYWIKNISTVDKSEKDKDSKKNITNKVEYLKFQKEIYNNRIKKLENNIENHLWSTSYIWGENDDDYKIIYKPFTGNYFLNEKIEGKLSILTGTNEIELYEDVEIDETKLYDLCKKIKEENEISLESDDHYILILRNIEKEMKLPNKILDEYKIYIKEVFKNIENEEIKNFKQDQKKRKIEKREENEKIKKKEEQKEKEDKIKDIRIKESSLSKTEIPKKKCTKRNPEANKAGKCPDDKPFKREDCCYKTKYTKKKVGGNKSYDNKRNLFSTKRRSNLVWRHVLNTDGKKENVPRAFSEKTYEKLGFRDILSRM